jgi:hypothetical protein
MSKSTITWVQYLIQAINYSVFMLMVWYFSFAPSFEHLGTDEAVVALALSHTGQHKEPCHRLTPEELAKLPPNMRKPVECGRERSPLLIEVTMDGQILFKEKANPPGLYGDGSINLFTDTRVPAGQHNFSIRMNDSIHEKGFNYRHQQTVELAPAQLLVIGFDTSNGFNLK